MDIKNGTFQYVCFHFIIWLTKTFFFCLFWGHFGFEIEIMVGNVFKINIILFLSGVNLILNNTSKVMDVRSICRNERKSKPSSQLAWGDGGQFVLIARETMTSFITWHLYSDLSVIFIIFNVNLFNFNVKLRQLIYGRFCVTLSNFLRVNRFSHYRRWKMGIFFLF